MRIASASIVGYANSKTITANTFSLGTTPFAAVGKDVVDVQNMMTTTAAPSTYSKRNLEAPMLQVWDGAGYKYYYYLTDAYVEETDDEVTGWANTAGDYATASIAPGTGYWYKTPKEASNFTLPGQVLDVASVTKDVFSSKFNLIGNPYPTKLDFSKIKTNVPSQAYKDRNTKALMLQVWDGAGYKYYYWLSDAYVEETDDEIEGWANTAGDFVAATTTEINYGMWSTSPNADGKLTFFKDAPVAD